MLIQKRKLLGWLVRNDLKFEYFDFSCRFCYPDNDKVYNFAELIYLSIENDANYKVYIFVHHLPNLQKFKVN